MEDAALLAAYAGGDRGAAALLTSRLLPRVFAQAMRMLQDRAEAEDVAQEAMLRLWKQAPDWRAGEAKVSTWMYRVTANLCTDRLRKRRPTEPLDAVAEPADGRASVLSEMVEAERRAALTAALGDLPERQAQAVSLRHLEGLSNPEIGSIMDMSVEAVESLIARGKRGLVQRLAGRKADLGYGNGDDGDTG